MDDMPDPDFYDPEGPDPASADQPETGVVKRGFGTTELVRHTETMSTAMAAAAQASIQARYIVALQRPRDLMAARAALMEQAERPTFAEAAIYRLPREKWDPDLWKRVQIVIEGPTIRFAEAARLAFKNIVTEVQIVHEDEQLRLILVTTTDLESNVTETGPVTVRKTKEVQKTYKGAVVLSQRANSQGQILYTVASSPSDVDQATNSAIARVKRNQILALIPANLKQDAIAACKLTLSNQTKQQLAATQRAASKAYADMGVPDAQITEYLGHPISDATADELQNLRGIAVAIRDGMTTWKDVHADAMAARQAEQAASIGLGGVKGGPTPPAPPPPPVQDDEHADGAAVDAANEARRKGTAAARAALGKAGS
jgi:hypothetical protein